ncbi:MAG TPA: PadR family transcriptional regulator [Gemmatimonadaceae bacterium]|jgi:transcriptional regulator
MPRGADALTVDNKTTILLSTIEVSTMANRADLLQGTLEFLILRTLRLGELHGWGISKRIRTLSNDVLQINQGSLYPALYRLEERGLIDATWGISPEGRKAKFYRLTDKGREALAEERASWRAFAGAVEAVLKGT